MPIETLQRYLTTEEFDAMMKEFAEAEDWMHEQLRQRRCTAQVPATTPATSDSGILIR
ncbi:hypothetical protein CFBP6411_04803 [Pseudomonas syringae group genomosp. 3]|uniref:Uncharacterized protein n=1 Tax=Pseudomonas syringae group genomosp. 3 TaxID=251701 RepID=A0A2K4WJT5_9PSED|nr:hypothetical protein CFBP6411_04803 [Pseudomonas syringae group genomosp. 3]